MNQIKSFFLGIGVAYGVYYITRKDSNGRSILDDLLDHPETYVKAAKDYAIMEAVDTVKEHLS